jgi:hypothetical protein
MFSVRIFFQKVFDANIAACISSGASLLNSLNAQKQENASNIVELFMLIHLIGNKQGCSSVSN